MAFQHRATPPLDNRRDRLKIIPIREQASTEARLDTNMNSSQNLPISKQPPEPMPMAKPCKHPRVRIVARQEDAEFVECQECGDVFDSSEFKDMAIEENAENIGPEEL
jgi:hypothetical protein